MCVCVANELSSNLLLFTQMYKRSKHTFTQPHKHTTHAFKRLFMYAEMSGTCVSSECMCLVYWAYNQSHGAWCECESPCNKINSDEMRKSNSQRAYEQHIYPHYWRLLAIGEPEAKGLWGSRILQKHKKNYRDVHVRRRIIEDSAMGPLCSYTRLP